MTERLVRIDPSNEVAVKGMLNEWLSGTDQVMPERLVAVPFDHFESYCRYITAVSLPQRFEDSYVFFMQNKNTNAMIGAVEIRVWPNYYHVEDMHKGNITLGIRPTHRKFGYGTKLLKLALSECKDLWLDRVYLEVPCNEICQLMIEHIKAACVGEVTRNAVTYKQYVVSADDIEHFD